ncbi:hypothetical protein ACFYRN_38635 [Streptomyces sp. NPDC005227]|uniref:hypothetical protein n=1 Tax=Streptomyces sp. NPDC005227 TaxID=3364707 RepID=UPI0036779F45
MSAVQRYGDLELSFTSDFSSYWATPSKSLWNYFVGGAYSSGQKVGPKVAWGKAGILRLKDVSADKSLLRSPVRWERIAEIPGHDLASPVRWAVWRPIPPEGYVALGDLIDVWNGVNEHYAPNFACVKKVHNGRPYVRQGECGTKIHEAGSVRLWSVVAPPYPDGDQDERLYLPCGNFTAVTSSGTPAPTATTWILDLPAVVEKREGPEIPELTSHARPPAQTIINDRIVTVPYYMVDDKGRDEGWKVENSPFYRVQRKRHFDLILYRDNRNGSVPQEESQAVTTGVTSESSESFSENTGITVGTSVGVTAGARPFGMGAETTVTASISTTVELGYERRTSISSMREETKVRGLNIPPRSSACLWMEHHELVPIRGNGDTLGNQAALGFATDYYVTGEYPSGSGVTYFEEEPSGARATKAPVHLPADLQEARPEPANVSR